MKTKLLSLVLITVQLHVFAGDKPAEDFVAHEWGTFTSVQGAEGIQLEWNPLITSDLPRFVYDRNRPTGEARRRAFSSFAAKSAFATLQRMETPVIYFYSNRERTVQVNVRFPQGLITEWYPQVTRFGPSSTTNRLEAELSRQSFLRWDEVRILPRESHQALADLLPNEKGGSHYFAARGAEADFLRVNPGKTASQKPEHEEFLFYRGIGHFQAPLRASLGDNEDYLRLSNTGAEELTHFFVLNVRKGQGSFHYFEKLAAKDGQSVKLNVLKNPMPLSDLQTQIRQKMEAALVQEGLYAAEAASMVDTWKDSWFAEDGLRVLYVLPRAWTDRILPLTLDPQPREVVRVMVGRAEMITPSVEWSLLKQIVRYSEGDSKVREQVVADVRDLGLGRFAEAAVRRITSRLPNREFSRHAWTLLDAVSKPAAGGKSLAQN